MRNYQIRFLNMVGESDIELTEKEKVLISEIGGLDSGVHSYELTDSQKLIFLNMQNKHNSIRLKTLEVGMHIVVLESDNYSNHHVKDVCIKITAIDGFLLVCKPYDGKSSKEIIINIKNTDFQVVGENFVNVICGNEEEVVKNKLNSIYFNASKDPVPEDLVEACKMLNSMDGIRVICSYCNDDSYRGSITFISNKIENLEKLCRALAIKIDLAFNGENYIRVKSFLLEERLVHRIDFGGNKENFPDIKKIVIEVIMDHKRWVG